MRQSTEFASISSARTRRFRGSNARHEIETNSKCAADASTGIAFFFFIFFFMLVWIWATTRIVVTSRRASTAASLSLPVLNNSVYFSANSSSSSSNASQSLLNQICVQFFSLLSIRCDGQLNLLTTTTITRHDIFCKTCVPLINFGNLFCLFQAFVSIFLK